jgi:hypothetical protein
MPNRSIFDLLFDSKFTQIKSVLAVVFSTTNMSEIFCQEFCLQTDGYMLL